MALASVPLQSFATWTVTNLHPSGATNSVANGIRSGRIVGGVNADTAMWTVSVPGWTTLGPGVLYKTDGVQQVGRNTSTAAVWTGTPGSFVPLFPTGTPNEIGAVASGVFSSEQVGYIFVISFTIVGNAGYWLDSAGTWTNINPPGAFSSECTDVHAGQRVGAAWFVNTTDPNAYIWYGSPTGVSVNPALSIRSYLHGVHSGKQVGYFVPIGDTRAHAGLWANTAASCVDLHPPTAYQSAATAVYLNRQAGWVEYTQGTKHAAYWQGNSASAVDLHAYLPPGYDSSEAVGIWTDNPGVNTYITGYALTPSNNKHAMLWKLEPDQTLSTNLHLQDTVAAFAATRPITYAVIKNNLTIASGVINANAPFTNASILVPQSQTGAAAVVFDGSSFLRRVVACNLTGNNQNLGQVNVSNGDADLSGEVDAADIDLVIADFGSMAVGNSDVDVSGEVDAADIDIVIANFGNVDQ